jgi:hypothetical protein
LGGGFGCRPFFLLGLRLPSLPSAKSDGMEELRGNFDTLGLLNQLEILGVPSAD